MGSIVTNYTLYRNQGRGDSNWTQIIGYNYAVSGYVATIVVSTESMNSGYFYTFVYKATNMIGDSLLSANVSIPIADKPTQPPAVTMVTYSSSSIVVSWQRVSNQ